MRLTAKGRPKAEGRAASRKPRECESLYGTLGPQCGSRRPWDYCRLPRQQLPLLCFCSHPASTSFHLIPRPLLAFLFCHVVQSHESQRTTNGVKSDQHTVA